MNNNPVTEVERELSTGERIVWSGRPRQGLRLRPQDAYMIPFSLLWGGFAIFWEIGVTRSHAPGVMSLFGIPFVLIGLYIIFGRFFADARTRQRTYYGVTNERIIIITGLFSRQTKSLQLRTLGEITLTERSDASGTITFGALDMMRRNIPAGWPGSSQYLPPSFDMIERAKEVYDLVRTTQKSAA